MDGSGSLTDSNKIVIDNNFVYPYGTTEQFPQMQDSDLTTLTNTAHYYMECSNKGKCDRSTGECQCYEGYDGVACQRASCPGYPNSCSGHGVCKTIKQLASSDNGNVYELWDKATTMGCECDEGYFGADCSQRQCKVGVDPLYLDDAATVKYSIFDFATLSSSPAVFSTTTYFTDGQSEPNNGKWAIKFYDSFGEDWITESIDAGATCAEVITALENIPNDVIPKDSLYCTRTQYTNDLSNEYTENHAQYDAQHDSTTTHPFRLSYKMAFWDSEVGLNKDELSPYAVTTNYTGSNDTSSITLSGSVYRLKFFGNPGSLKQPEIEIYLDGKRPTMVSPGYKVLTKVWTDGQQGENKDYFADHCDGVSVTISKTAVGNLYTTKLSGLTTDETKLLKKCLGGSDFDDTNNIDIYNWDRGSKLYPHIVKLVRTVTTSTDGGYYAVLYVDASDNFKLINPFFPPDAFSTDNYDIYTTKGVLALTSNFSEVTFGFGSRYIYSTNVTYDINSGHAFYDGDLSCETGNSNSGKFNYIHHCLNKTDIVTFLNWESPQLNPPHINLYTIDRLYTRPYWWTNQDRFVVPSGTRNELHYMTHQITVDLSTNWGASVGKHLPDSDTVGAPNFHVYKFFPSADSTYEYVAECSNRGICDRSSALCKCFPGYTNDDCSIQSSLSV